MKYAVIFEKSSTGFGAYVPDLPGCVATGRSLATTQRRIQEAIEMHLQGMREDGDEIPLPTTQASYVLVPGRNGHRKKAVKSATRRTSNGKVAARRK